jgi:hypothetical protein
LLIKSHSTAKSRHSTFDTKLKLKLSNSPSKMSMHYFITIQNKLETMLQATSSNVQTSQRHHTKTDKTRKQHKYITATNIVMHHTFQTLICMERMETHILLYVIYFNQHVRVQFVKYQTNKSKLCIAIQLQQAKPMKLCQSSYK